MQTVQVRVRQRQTAAEGGTMTGVEMAALVEALSVQQVTLLLQLCKGRLQQLAGPPHQVKRRRGERKVYMVDPQTGKRIAGGAFRISGLEDVD